MGNVALKNLIEKLIDFDNINVGFKVEFKNRTSNKSKFINLPTCILPTSVVLNGMCNSDWGKEEETC